MWLDITGVAPTHQRWTQTTEYTGIKKRGWAHVRSRQKKSINWLTTLKRARDYQMNTRTKPCHKGESERLVMVKKI